MSGIDFGVSAHMKIPKELWISLLKRNIFGFITLLCSFLSIKYMPVSTSVSIMQASAFVTSIFAFFVRNEKLGLFEILIIVLGLFGCLMLANTQLFVENDEINLRMKNDMAEHPYFYLGVIFGVASTVMNALKFLTMSELGNVVHTKF